MNSKVLGVIAGMVLAAVLFWPSGTGKVEELFNKAEKLYEAGNYYTTDPKDEDAVTMYQVALDEADEDSELYSEFYILVNYKIALCYSNIAEQYRLRAVLGRSIPGYHLRVAVWQCNTRRDSPPYDEG